MKKLILLELALLFLATTFQSDNPWEMGFFDPDFNNPDVNSNDKSKYFMMVNRRCVQEVDIGTVI